MQDNPASVEFIPSGDSAGGAPKPRRRWSRRWELAFAAVALVVIALVQRGLRSDAPAAPTTGSPSSSASPSDALRNAHCPSEGFCFVTVEVPPAVPAALRDAVPGIRLGPATTVRAMGGILWYRQVSARVGNLKLIVQVVRPGSVIGTLAPARFDPDHGLVLVRKNVDGFVVQVQADAPRSAMPPTATLNRLARDRRLLQLD